MPVVPEVRPLAPAIPVASAVARALLDDAPDFGATRDLTGDLVIVPTRTAGRKLREALAREAESRGLAGVLLPKILTPDAALHAFREPAPTASAEASQMAMNAALAAFRPEELAALFPAPPEPWNLATLREAARALLKTRRSLGEAADTPDFHAVAARADNPEQARWRDMARVEERHRALLAEHGLSDAEDLRAATVRAPRPPAGVKRVVLAATPSTTPALRRLLANAGLPVLALVAGETAAFDGFGAPAPAYWRDRELPWQHFDGRVRNPDTTRDLARDLASLFAGRAPDGRVVSAVAADTALTDLLQRVFADAGGSASPSEGIALDRHPHAIVLREWADFLRDDSWENFGRLLRRPAFAASLAPAGGEKPGLSMLLREYDRVGETLLPGRLPTFAEATTPGRLVLEGALDVARDRRGDFLRRPFDVAVTAFLATLGVAGHRLDTPFTELVDASAKEFAGLLAAFPGHDAAEALSLLHRRLGAAAHHPEAPAEAVSVRGWLELLWDDNPHVVIAGMNEGCVPESFSADAFIPGAFREKLGLPGDDDRLARDLHTLDVALRLRADGRGRFDVFAPKSDVRGEPLRPSRLLFSGAGEALPGRVVRLFAEAGNPPPEPARTRGWKWRPPVDATRLAKVAAGIPPTAFADYLDCPFRFFLKRVAGMRPNDPDRAEPDAAAFGDFVHAVLKGFAGDPTERDLTDEELLRAALDRRVDEQLKRTYGDRPPLAALIQANAARARLHGFARTQAEHRASGWKIVSVEKSFTFAMNLGDGAPPFVIEGRFDRIDRHEDGRILVIDYKTSDSGKTPKENHLKRPRSGAYESPAYAFTEAMTNAKGEALNQRWTNLQLPLYHEAAVASGLGASDRIGTAYWLLPSAVSEVALSVWDGYSRELHLDALACVAGVALDIRARRYFPPNPKPEQFDDFAVLLGDSPEDAVDREFFQSELAKA